MQIQCTFTRAEEQYLQLSLKENTQFFIDASTKPNGYWSTHAVRLEGPLLQEEKEIHHRLSHKDLSDIFDSALNTVHKQSIAKHLIVINEIFTANGWNAYKHKKSSTQSYTRYNDNIDFLQHLAWVGEAFWEEHAIYMELGRLTVPTAHAPRTAIQAIAKQILAAEEVPITTKIEVVKGALAIFEGYEWTFEGAEALVRCTDSSGTTATETTPLSVLLTSPMLYNGDMIEEDGSMPQPFFQAPRNTTVIDFKNFVSYYAGKRTLESLSIREWAGVLSIGHHLDFHDHKNSDGIDRITVRDYLGCCDNLETLDAVFEATGTTLPEKVAAYVLHYILISLCKENFEEKVQQLTNLPHFEAVRLISFRQLTGFSIVQQFFPNVETW